MTSFKYLNSTVYYNTLSKSRQREDLNSFFLSVLGKNRYISSPTSLASMYVASKILFGRKPMLLKAKRSALLSGIREGDNLGILVSLKGKGAGFFLDRLVYDYSSSFDMGRTSFLGYSSSTFSLVVKNISKVDQTLASEQKSIKPFSLSIISNASRDSALGIYSTLSHLGYSFRAYEK